MSGGKRNGEEGARGKGMKREGEGREWQEKGKGAYIGAGIKSNRG
jgi:hypothetical protein